MPHILETKSVGSLGTVIAIGGVVVRSVVGPCKWPPGMVQAHACWSAGRMGRPYWSSGFIATITSSRGFILIVSFQPYSLLSGGLIAPSHPTRFKSCTLKRWNGTDGYPRRYALFPDLGLVFREDLRGRLRISHGDRGLVQVCGERQFDTERGVHLAVWVPEFRIALDRNGMITAMVVLMGVKVIL